MIIRILLHQAVKVQSRFVLTILLLGVMINGFLFLSDRIARFAIRQGLDSNTKLAVFVIRLIVITMIGFLETSYEFREQTLSDVIRFPTEEKDYMQIDVNYYSENIQEEDVEGLNRLLSQYRVK